MDTNQTDRNITQRCPLPVLAQRIHTQHELRPNYKLLIGRNHTGRIISITGEILKFVITAIIISCKFFFLFIGRELTTWPADNCLQIMVCSCAMSFNCVWLQIIFCSYANSTALFSFLRLLLRENGRYLLKNKLGDRMMEQLSNPIIAVFSRRSIMICSPLTNHHILLNLVQ